MSISEKPIPFFGAAQLWPRIEDQDDSRNAAECTICGNEMRSAVRYMAAPVYPEGDELERLKAGKYYNATCLTVHPLCFMVYRMQQYRRADSHNIFFWTVFGKTHDRDSRFCSRLFADCTPTDVLIESQDQADIAAIMQDAGFTYFPRAEADEPQIIGSWMT